ncbi:hypothetical protein LUI11_38575 [Bradyrhizobium diazoefficiens]|uniref:Uncharacterized protein n=1 Tax=Bradyrhizobium diazoefficiens SEMIA 5080 TaxID=754504 RepID=A0A837CQ23_9BRAD|nr:hypothetical protein [Bradyrhizobium diazoefficiens]APO52371.1 hypothetical protein BD122_18905 [Bradyrhizobium diazoefficiens]KGJ71068.1 hypothetical protein BJA5080_06289 [Bradyrhizobium diazoefficiens SEMIA 5080]MCD9298402.1 hypothetical protein [Bradyrhizobium diazoefficiens]MCD9815708.1 hypothetical protein [Bradyrhizobium diazoefficiens]MCD9833641.1 hypothetical protein [Bradyrhizobium diazoefficiens]
MRKGAIAFTITIASHFTASAQAPSSNVNSSGNPGIYKLMDARLPDTPKYSIAVESLAGAQVGLYEDPDTAKKRFFIMPFLLPDWNALKQTITSNCPSAQDTPVAVALPLEFFRETVRDEVAKAASRISGTQIQREQIWMYPYAWMYVEVNAADKAYPRRIVAQYPTTAKDFAVKERALRITPPEPVVATFTASCDELRRMYDTKDISGKFYAPYTEMKKNIFSVTYRDFEGSESFRSIVREESASGDQAVRSTASAGGFGFNFSSFGGGAKKSDAETRVVDTRKRFVSSNLVADAAKTFAKTLNVVSRREFESKGYDLAALAEELRNFVIKNSRATAARIERLDNNTWQLVTPEITRTITNDQMKQVVTSSDKYNIEFGQKTSIGCASGDKKDGEDKKDGAAGANPYCVSVDKNTKFADDNQITWDKQGETWIPTSVVLYAVSAEQISDSVDFQIVDSLAAESGILQTELQPVVKQHILPADLKQLMDEGFQDRVKPLLAQQAKAMEDSLTKLKSGMKVSTQQICTGEYDGPCSPYRRFDPRDWPMTRIGPAVCPKGASYFPTQLRVTSGGCCGYAWYNITCVAFE